MCKYDPPKQSLSQAYLLEHIFMPTTTLNNNTLCRNNDYVLISFNDHSKKYSHLLLFLLPTVPQLNGMEPCWIWMRVCSVTACRQLFGLKPYFLWFWEPVEPFFFFFFFLYDYCRWAGGAVYLGSGKHLNMVPDKFQSLMVDKCSSRWWCHGITSSRG